jgi:hypothetical protein
MAKKEGKKEKGLSNKEMQQLLIENFVGLQRAMTNLSIKFEGLAEQMNRLLEIFEISAKNFISGETEESKKDMINKVNSLLEQNKVIAGGLVMIEEKLRNQPDFTPLSKPTQNQVIQKPRPLPRI